MLRLASYDCFAPDLFGGNIAYLVDGGTELNDDQMARIAREFGVPATCFVQGIDDAGVRARFFAPGAELPMCGHGTICLLTHLMESGAMQAGPDIRLRLPKSEARVAVEETPAGRFRVMLDIKPPRFEPAPTDSNELLGLLDLDADALANGLPVETARGDFIHLVVPLAGLEAMRAMRPDFSAMLAYCKANGIETIAAFCRETEDVAKDLHVRDFCPAVGVAESAAAGTT